MRTCETTAPFFCASPVMSSTVHALALEVRRHAEQRADGDDAGAADAGDEDAVGLVGAGARGLGQRRERRSAPACLRACAASPPSTVTKLGQKPFTQE